LPDESVGPFETMRASSSAAVRGATRATAVGFDDDEEQAPANTVTTMTATPTRTAVRIRVVYHTAYG
jgi:hypothetical protein